VTWSDELVGVDNGVASRQWQAEFARIYSVRERCTPGQARQVASILLESLCLVPPLEAVRTVLADGDLLEALRSATREVQQDSPARRSDGH